MTQLSSVIEIAGECLREPNGHLYYVGSGEFALTGHVKSLEEEEGADKRVLSVDLLMDQKWLIRMELV